MEKITISGVTLEGYAQGGYQTSVYVPEVRAVFDTGFPVPANVDRYFITHSHPDHICALPYLAGKRSIQGKKAIMHVHVPEVIASKVEGVLMAMDELYGDRGEAARIKVHPTKPGDLVHLSKRFGVRGLQTMHRGPSIGWAVEETVSKLKPEFKGMEGKEIGRIRQSGVAITDDKTHTMLCIPGDTKIEFLLEQEQARKAKVLLHEVTVWDDGYSNVEGARHFGHTHIAEMAEHCEKFEGEALVLVHRSMRYSRKRIEEIAKKRLPASMLPKIHFFDGGDR